MPQAAPQRRVRSRTKRAQQFTTATTYAAVLALIASIVSVGYQSPVQQQVDNRATAASASVVSAAASSPSVDQVVAANLAATTAATANLSVASNVTELSTSLNAKSELAQSDDNLLSKPQIIQPNAGQRGITTYRTVAGDTVPEVAAKYGVSVDTIKWANNLTNDTLVPGTDLAVPGTTGVVYTVRSGDTAASLAQKYQTAESRIVSYNDLELTGLTPGQRIVLPGGILPAAERPTVRTTTSSSASTASYANAAVVGNRYAYGYCTWYAYNRRAQLGRPVGSFWGNASTWASYARGSGYLVDHNPEVGAVLQDSYVAGGLGHVAVVESIHSDGSITVSEMNYVGWNVMSYRTISAGQAAGYNYIH